MVEEINWEIWIEIYTKLHIKQIANKDLLAQGYIFNGLFREKKSKKKSGYMYN